MTDFPDRRYYSRIAAETGFRVEPLETMFRLVGVLAAVSARSGDELSLRGGTALNLLHLDLPRLSVDIDLDFVGSPDAETAQSRRAELLAELEDLARGAGYLVTPERPSYAMAHLRLSYINVSGRPAQLKLDVNFLDRVPLLPLERLLLRHPFGDDLPAREVLTLALPELAASKTIALARRALARDLFDTAMLSTLADLDDDLVRSALVIRGASYPPPSPADYSADVVDRVRAASWRSEVVAFARRPIPLELEAARTLAADLIRRATVFTAGHREFMRSLERGEIRSDLLPASVMVDRVRTNPGLLWRLRVGADALEER